MAKLNWMLVYGLWNARYLKILEYFKTLVLVGEFGIATDGSVGAEVETSNWKGVGLEMCKGVEMWKCILVWKNLWLGIQRVLMPLMFNFGKMRQIIGI